MIVNSINLTDNVLIGLCHMTRWVQRYRSHIQKLANISIDNNYLNIIIIIVRILFKDNVVGNIDLTLIISLYFVV
jgi:hypothetical protein